MTAIDTTVPLQRASHAPAASTVEAVRRLRNLVDQSAGRWKRWMILEAVALLVGVPLAYLWLVFLLDNLLHLPVWCRILANAIFVIATLSLLVSLVRRWRKLNLTEDQVALAMERQTGGVQNRLINSLQLSRDTREQNVDFGYAVIEENYKTLQKIAIHQAGQLRPAMLRVAFAAVVILVGIAFWILEREHFTNAAARIMLPLADVAPIYQTLLEVTPGDAEGSGDIPIQVKIKGKIPTELTVLRVVNGVRSGETVAVPSSQSQVDYTFKGIDRTMTYAVRGGDFVTQYYTIKVPTPSALTMVKVTYQFPAYTKLPEKTTQSAGGDLEALINTKAKLTFVFDHAAEEASLLLHKVGSREPQRIALQKLGDTEFAGEITFADVVGYQLETRQAGRTTDVSSRYALHVRADQEPNLLLSGLTKQAEASPDATLPLTIDAADDFGLEKVGLFARRVPDSSSDSTATTQGAADEGWKPVEVWPAEGALTFRKQYAFAIAGLGAVEGEKYEVAARGTDADPLRNGKFVTGNPYTLVIGGEGVALQLMYEQILRTEAELKALITSEEATITEVNTWMQKMNPASGLRWDEQANLDALAAGTKAVGANQDKVRQTAGRVAREMVAHAGNLRLSVGLLADTEMVRVIRILDSVPTQDTLQSKRGALADAKLTQERTVRSLKEIVEQYTRFRQDWELSNMIPFAKMLADRQTALAAESTKTAAIQTDATRQNAANRRQAKVQQLCELSSVAFAGMATRVKTDESIMSAAFTAASAAYIASELKTAMTEAASLVGAGKWSEAAAKQDVAAKTLTAIHDALQAAKLEAAKQALAALQEKAKSDKELQKEIDRLRAGHTENAMKDIDAAMLTMAEIIEMREKTAGKKFEVDPEQKVNEYKYNGGADGLQFPDMGIRQQHDILKLPTAPTGLGMRFPNQSDTASNNVKPHIQQEFEDLAGELLDEAELMIDKYDTYNLNLGTNINEGGDIGKQGGDMNSTAASAATGNQKPPPNDQGGISRQGRLGARAHGMVMGDEGINRRGRDEAQDGQERTPDQEGTIKQKHSDDEQKDISTGMGGKKVETDAPTNFNTADKGTFTEEMAGKMGKVAEKNVIVERQDGKLDPRIADMLRDLEGSQDQMIERIKAIRKELKNLYLPTDRIDETIAQLTANMESLKERPSADLFRAQAQTLDQLRRELKVFTQYGSGFQPSLPRDQAVKGRVLDEPARQPMPGYEAAVKSYYETLSTTP